MSLRLACLGACGLFALLLGAPARAADSPLSGPAAGAVQLELFEAVAAGQIKAELIGKSSKEANLLIKNNLDRPVAIRLPEAFAGVPVLAQIGNNNNNNNNNNANQGVGGGFGGGGGGGGQQGGGFFNVPAEKQLKVEVAVVCLDHGKRDPNPRVKYTIQPIENYTSKPGVRELCAMLGRGEIDQRTAQAAAWHLNNDLTWQELASKVIKHLTGASEPYFYPAELERAHKAASAAVALAQENQKKIVSPGEQASAE